MTYIRKGEPYPYNLDRPPPPAHHPALTDVKPQEASATSPVDASSVMLPDQAQSNVTQSLMAAVNGTGSEIDKLFSKLIPVATPAATPLNSFTSASTPASSTLASYLVRPPSTTANKGPALLETIFASATPPQGPVPAPTPPFPHHVSSEPFPPPPSAPPSTRLAFATPNLRGDISSSEPESSKPPSPTCHTATTLIHSPQPTNSQLPQILTQDVISALLGMPPSRTSSVASSHRRYEGDVESGDDPHEVDSPIDERPQTHANCPRKHELGDVTPRPPLRGFASSEKVLPSLAPPFPSHHSAPSALPSAASSVPSVSAPSEPAPTVVMVDAPATAVPAPRVGTSPAPRALVPFHEESSLWPYPRAPLDDREDIVELDFADTSALSDVDAFERRRQNGRNAKLSKKDRAREREEIERSWDVPAGNGNAAAAATNVIVAAGSPGPHPAWSRPSSSQAPSVRNTVGSNGSAAPAQSSPQSCAHKTNQSKTTSAPVKTSAASTTGGQAMASTPPTSNNKSKSKSKHAVNGSNAKVSVPAQSQGGDAVRAVSLLPHAEDFGVPTVPGEGNSQIGSKSKKRGEIHITRFYTHLTLVDAAWIWGQPPPSPSPPLDSTHTDTRQTQTNGVTALAKSATSAAIVEAVHGRNLAHNHTQTHSNVNGSASLSTMTDRNEFVREVLTLIHVRSLSLSFLLFFHLFPFRSHFLFPLPLFNRRIRHSWINFGRNIVRVREPRPPSPTPYPTGVIRYYPPPLPHHPLPQPSSTPQSPIPIPCHPVSHRDISVHV